MHITEEDNKMSKIYKPCLYCISEILKKPILEKHQGRYSILCPYCLSYRSEWVDSIEAAIVSWNTFLREDDDDTADTNENQEADELFPPRYGTY